MEKRYTEGAWSAQVDETKLMERVHEMERSSSEETLNAFLDAETDEICSAKCEHSPERVDTPNPGSLGSRTQAQVIAGARFTLSQLAIWPPRHWHADCNARL